MFYHDVQMKRKLCQHKKNVFIKS